MNSEVCRPCNEEMPFVVQPTDDIALCNAHWNAWLNLYLNFDYTGNDAPPCAAHLIRSEAHK